MKIPLRSGRLLERDDLTREKRVAVISEALAQRLWPNDTAVGKILMVDGEFEVVGVVGNVRHDRATEPEMYLIPAFGDCPTHLFCELISLSQPIGLRGLPSEVGETKTQPSLGPTQPVPVWTGFFCRCLSKLLPALAHWLEDPGAQTTVIGCLRTCVRFARVR